MSHNMAAVTPPPVHIGVTGLIGAGKTTLVRALAPLLGAQALVERYEDNPYFERFYRDPGRWAYHHYTFFLDQCLTDRRRAQQAGGAVVQERVLLEHLLVFAAQFRAQGHLDDSDYGLLDELTRTCDGLAGPSDLVIHIDIDVDEALRRIRDRGRSAESAIDPEYLGALSARYAAMLAQGSFGEVLRVPAAEYDFREAESMCRIADRVRATVAVA